MAHFSLFVFLAVLYYALPVAAQANSTQSSNVDVVGLYVDGSKGEKNSSWRHYVRTIVQLTLMGCSYNPALPSSN